MTPTIPTEFAAPDAGPEVLAASPFFDIGEGDRVRVILFRGKWGGFTVNRDSGGHVLSHGRYFDDYTAAVARWAGEVVMLAVGGLPVEGGAS